MNMVMAIEHNTHWPVGKLPSSQNQQWCM